jgi:hypothetical protein
MCSRLSWRLLACGADSPRLKGTVQPWFIKTDDEPPSFTPPGNEADRLQRCEPLATHTI